MCRYEVALSHWLNKTTKSNRQLPPWVGYGCVYLLMDSENASVMNWLDCAFVLQIFSKQSQQMKGWREQSQTEQNAGPYQKLLLSNLFFCTDPFSFTHLNRHILFETCIKFIGSQCQHNFFYVHKTHWMIHTVPFDLKLNRLHFSQVNVWASTSSKSLFNVEPFFFMAFKWLVTDWNSSVFAYIVPEAVVKRQTHRPRPFTRLAGLACMHDKKPFMVEDVPQTPFYTKCAHSWPTFDKKGSAQIWFGRGGAHSLASFAKTLRFCLSIRFFREPRRYRSL